VNCPKCKTKLKQENFTEHMQYVHNKIIDDAKIKSLETSNKKIQEKKTPRLISKTTIGIIIIIFLLVVASIYIYYSFNDSNVPIDKKSYFVSIGGKGDYISIQEAIDSASDYDTIFVSNGTYFENIIIAKPLELIGEDENSTIINGNGSGIVVNISADYVKISGFAIKNGGSLSGVKPDAGIEIGSSYNTISDCYISSNKNYGLYLYANPNSTNNTIKYNIFSNNKYGIFLYYAKTNNISSNTFTNNTDYGIYFGSRSNDNLISDNNFKENNYAIRIKTSEKNTIINNLIMNNRYGVYFCCGAENNIAYNNIFINNTNWNADDNLGNTWDNGIVGNYWDDYNGTDANGDGIGDTPYLTNLDKGDMFPLMQPNKIM
jgi:nitrous oxidase accessory protein